jgi:hypothetical protein
VTQTSATQQGVNRSADNNAIRPLPCDHCRGLALPKPALALTPGTDGAAHWPPGTSFGIGQTFSRQNPRIDLTSTGPNNPSILASPSDAKRQNDEPVEGPEKEWRQRLRSLEEWICELLIQNQQLRMSLPDSAPYYRPMEADQ